jgi:hypothetical protein
MKRTILARLACCLLAVLMLVPTLTMCSDNKDRATLIVNGKEVKRAKAYIHGEYPVIPLIATLEACGYEVSWTSSDTVVVTIDTVRYTISLTDMTMYAEGQTQNLLYVPEEAYEYTCQVSGKDILIYCYRLEANFTRYTNIKFDYSKDLKNSIIYASIKVVVDA